MSKKAANKSFLREVRQPCMAELTIRASRNALDELHAEHFLRRVKQKFAFPNSKRKGIDDRSTPLEITPRDSEVLAHLASHMGVKHCATPLQAPSDRSGSR